MNMRHRGRGFEMEGAGTNIPTESTLKTRLHDWCDWDVAAYSLGICLGLMPDELAFGAVKHVFWTNHPIGRMLHDTLEVLVQNGILEKRDEPDIQYRWLPALAEVASRADF